MVSNPGELEVLCGDMMGAGATSIHESNFLFSLAIVGVCRNFIEWWQGAKVKFGIKPVTCRPRRRTLNTEQRARTLWGWWWWWWWLSLLTSCCEGRKERCLLWYFLRRGFSENERWVERDVGVGGVYIGERGWRKDARNIKEGRCIGYEWVQVDGAEQVHVVNPKRIQLNFFKTWGYAR